MTNPERPSVNTKARASGMPAKFEATPEKVMSAPRIRRGRPPEITAYASRNPKIVARDRRHEADLDAGEVRLARLVAGEVDVVLDRERAVVVLEAADDQVDRRDDQERDGEGQWNGTTPSQSHERR